ALRASPRARSRGRSRVRTRCCWLPGRIASHSPIGRRLCVTPFPGDRVFDEVLRRDERKCSTFVRPRATNAIVAGNKNRGRAAAARVMALRVRARTFGTGLAAGLTMLALAGGARAQSTVLYVTATDT